MHRSRVWSSFLTLGLLLAVPGRALAAGAELHGRVVDEQGKPVAHVFVHQEGALATAFTDANGDFSLAIDPHAPRVLLASGADLVPLHVSLQQANQPLVMQAAPIVSPPMCLIPMVATTPAPAGPLDSGFALRGDWRSNNYVGQHNSSVTGAVDGEVGLDLTVRQHQEGCKRGAIVELDAIRNRPAIHVAGLSAGSATTFQPESLEGTLALGYLFHPGFDLGPYVVGYARSASSFANGAQLTGTPLDWDDTRWAGGLGFQAAGWIYRACHLVWAARVEGYPLVSDHLSGGNVPAQLSGLFGGKAAVSVGWEFMPQLRLNVGYDHELWRANQYAEDADTWSVGLGYYPGRARP